ncbi:MAG: class I SAM-dependent methyltransferase [Ardenticatenia bacterium]|nr:class I SAM-dependent methyltransferase [Ardenticatenia bacterium]
MDRSRLPQRIAEDGHWWFAGRTRALRAVLEPYLPSRELLILDVGSGAGNMYHHLSRYGYVIGVENHPNPVRVGRARGYDIRQADARALPFADNTFDVVTALDVIEHNEDDVAILQEAHRVLKPGGLMLISVPAFQWLWSFNDELNAHVRRYTRDELEQKLLQVGLRAVRQTYNNFLIFPVAVLTILFSRLRPPKALKSHYFEDDAYQVDMVPTHPLVNAILMGVGWAESHLLRRVDLPLGTGLIALARKEA